MREIRTLRATWRGLETWRVKCFDLSRRASPRPYLGARGGEIPPRDSLPVISPVADLCVAGHRLGSLNFMQLGRACLLVAGPAPRVAAEHRSVVAKGVCRQHDIAGARSRQWPH